jgi:pyruvate formate lyase activating enzyme
MAKGLIFDIKRYAIHDGPGIRTTVFLKGCPLKCLWCDNPESQASCREFVFWPERCLHCNACIDVCEKEAIVVNDNQTMIDEGQCDFCGTCVGACYPEALQIVGREMSVEALLEEIEKDTDFYRESGGGVTFSGGEPFSQPEFLFDMVVASKGRNLHTTIDTCGLVSWDILRGVNPFVDLFLYDIKLMDEERHREYTGVSNRLILSNLQKLAETCPVIVRVPLIPNINDDEENIRNMGEFLLNLKALEAIDLLPYHKLGVSKYKRLNKPYAIKDVTPPTPERIRTVQKALEEFGFRVTVGG